MKSILTGKKSIKTQKGITLIALVVTIIVLLILAGVSIAMLTGQNGILRRAEEAGTNTAHAEVYEILNLQTVDYMTESKLGEYSGSLIQYLLDKEYIKKTGEEGKYLIDVEKLLGQKGKYGNGTGNVDVYKLEDALGTGSITKVATTSEPTVSVGSGVYNVVYYGKEGSTPIPLGKIMDSVAKEITFYITSEKVPELNGTYKALEGMTWREWLESKYRISGFGVDGYDTVGYDTEMFNDSTWENYENHGCKYELLDISTGVNHSVDINDKIISKRTYKVRMAK